MLLGQLLLEGRALSGVEVGVQTVLRWIKICESGVVGSCVGVEQKIFADSYVFVAKFLLHLYWHVIELADQ